MTEKVSDRMDDARKTLGLCAKLAEQIAAQGVDPRSIALGFHAAAVSLGVEILGPKQAAENLKQAAIELEEEHLQ